MTRPGRRKTGIPVPSSTGITDISTRSTRPAASRLRNSSPPPKMAMSFPGVSFSSLTTRSASASILTFG